MTCFDVLEHLLWEDWEASVKELARLCSRRLLLLVSNEEDTFGAKHGTELHVTRLPYEETDGLLREWLPGWDVRWRKEVRVEGGALWECFR